MRQEQLESQAHNAGYKNGIRLAIIGSKKYANMLQQQIDEVETKTLNQRIAQIPTLPICQKEQVYLERLASKYVCQHAQFNLTFYFFRGNGTSFILKAITTMIEIVAKFQWEP